MLPRFLLALAALTAATCVAADSIPLAQDDANARTARVSPLAGVTPVDTFEADLIAHPHDVRGLAAHAVLLNNRAAVAEPETAQALRRKARAFAAAAIQGGSQDLLMPLLLDQIREDGSLVKIVHSVHKAADDLIAQGEREFARGATDAALAAYLEAWEIDPRSDHAAVFIGDVHFVRKDYDVAIEWFDRAIALRPSNETAHRYRGDALMRLRRTNDARESYISAVIADPYNRITRSMLPQWAAQTRQKFFTPDTSFPRGQLTVKDGKIQLGYNPADGHLSVAYLISRASYLEKGGKITASYRHGLEEEAHGLRSTLQIATEIRGAAETADELNRHASSIEFLQRLVDTDLIEAHILLDRSDEGIVHDYAAYRDAHPERLRSYIREIWLGQN